jgi:hypothetical protein
LPGLACSLPGAATVCALPGEDQIDLYIGEAIWIELIPRRRSAAKRLQEVRAIVDAVAAGDVEETVWGSGARSWSKAKILLPDGTAIRPTDGSIWVWTWWPRRRVRRVPLLVRRQPTG